MERKWYQQTWAIIASLWFFFPAGLYLMWRYASWSGRWKWGITGIAVALVALTALGAALPAEDPLAGLTPEQVVSVHATATQEALAAQEEEARQDEIAAQEVVDEAKAAKEEERKGEEEAAKNAEAFAAKVAEEAAECAYLETVRVQGEDLGDAFAQLGVLMINPQYFSNEWRTATARQMTIIQATYDKAAALNPPESVQEVHDAYLEGTRKFHNAMALLSEGINNLDADAVDEANNLMLQGEEDIEHATGLMLEFVVAHSLSC